MLVVGQRRWRGIARVDDPRDKGARHEATAVTQSVGRPVSRGVREVTLRETGRPSGIVVVVAVRAKEKKGRKRTKENDDTTGTSLFFFGRRRGGTTRGGAPRQRPPSDDGKKGYFALVLPLHEMPS
mmetsp:Transcript_7218/g.29982  ORF Transcript_7218/g.29982 Transcript_7218/m.29982 type:complete len:126 (-) Transcript_7218:928-1305(-)